MKSTVLCCLLLLAVAIASCEAPDKAGLKFSENAMLIRGVNVIDVRDGNILENRSILIDSMKILWVGNYTNLKTPVEPAYQIDAKGKFAIPGLWDLHVHFEGEDLVEDNLALFPVYVAHGITTVRDMASDLGEQVLRWREEIEQGKILGPQIYTAGRKLEGVNSIWKGDLEIANEQELDSMLDKLEAYEVDLVKITENTLSGPLFLKSVQEASKRGFMVSGHVPLDLTIGELVDAGFSSVEHASYLLRLGADERQVAEGLRSGALSKYEAVEYYASHFDQDKATAAYEELGATGIAVTPTLIGGRQLAYLDEDDHQDDDFLDYLTDRFTSKYQWRIDRMAGETSDQKKARKEKYNLIAGQLPHLQQAGVMILAGSDAAALNTYVYPARSLHEELVLFQNAGLSPLEILQSATINGARFMGTSSTMGTVEAGKQADLVLLNSNPLKDIESTQDIFAVVNNGNYLDRVKLDDLLEQAKQKKKQLDQQRKSASSDHE